MTIILHDIQAAEQRIRPHLHPTPLEYHPTLGDNVYLKLENANLTHSFKIRGALNAALALDDAAKARGLVAASSGNHAQGLAYAAQLVGASAKIVMPNITPQRKIDGVTRYGAEAVIAAGDYDVAEAEARRLEQVEGRTFVSAYNDPFVAAGQGTIGLEIIAQLPDVERVVVCVSGGGLIAGIATAVKALRPQVEVIGVGSKRSPAMYNRFYKADLPLQDEVYADALAGDIEDGCITVPLTQQNVDAIVLVDDAMIVDAVRWSVLDAGWVVEGGGAVGIAAFRAGIIPNDGRKTAVVVSGGNIDGDKLKAIVTG